MNDDILETHEHIELSPVGRRRLQQDFETALGDCWETRDQWDSEGILYVFSERMSDELKGNDEPSDIEFIP